MKQRLIFSCAIPVMVFILFLSTGQPSPLYGNEHAHYPAVQTGPLVPDTPDIQVRPTQIVSQQVVNTRVEHSLAISNTGDTDLVWSIFEASDTNQSLSSGGNWVDTFDTYPTGSNMHGVGGWKGWDNHPSFTAFTTDVRARSAPNSLDIASNSDLVREFSVSSGYWTFTAWQYVPSSMTGSSFFIMLNTYNDNGLKNWSVQVRFDGSTNTVTNEGIAGGTATLITDRWVELRVEIDLDQDTQAFFYDDQVLYLAPWSEGVSGNGATNIAAVNLYANGTSSVYYDDISLLPWIQYCGTPTPIDWTLIDPVNGVIPPNAATTVTVIFDTTDLRIGTHRGTLCVLSNDPGSPLIPVPLTTLVVRGEPDHELFLPVIVKN